MEDTDDTRSTEAVVDMEGKWEAPDYSSCMVPGLEVVGNVVVHAGEEDNGPQLAVAAEDNWTADVHMLEGPNWGEGMEGQAEDDLMVVAGLDIDDGLGEADNASLASWTSADFE